MYIVNPHITAYYFNRKIRKRTSDGKHIYCYPDGDQIYPNPGKTTYLPEGVRVTLVGGQSVTTGCEGRSPTSGEFTCV